MQGIGRALLGLACLWVVASPAAAQQQTRDVSGTVTDSTGKGLANAMVVALTRADSVLARFATTDGNGRFVVTRVPAGDYILQVTMAGYVPWRKDVTVAATNVSAGTVTLSVMAYALDPLVVSAQHVPFVNRKDTLDYNALAFTTRPNATAEDLLRLLPGVQVEPDGSIKAQGKDVQRVLVEGKEFFGNDPKIATRNLSADAIKRVQVFDKQSDLAEFTGILDGREQTTINLILNDDAKRGYFGRAAGGGGMELDRQTVAGAASDAKSRYQGAVNVNRFSPSTQLALIGSANNVSQAGFSWGNAFEFVGGAKAGGDRGAGGMPGAPGSNGGLTRSQALGLNANHDLTPGRWLHSSYFLSDLNNAQNAVHKREQLLGSSATALELGTSIRDTDNVTHRLNVNTQYEFAKGHDLRFRSDLSAASSVLSSSASQETRDSHDNLRNESSSLQSFDGSNLDGSGRLTWRKRLNEAGRSVVGEAWASVSDPELRSDLDAHTGLVDGSGRVIENDRLQRETQSGRTLQYAQRLSIIEPIRAGYTIELFGEHSATDETNDHAVFDVAGGNPVLNNALSSNFERSYSYLRGGFRLNRQSENRQIVFGLQVQHSNLDGTILDRDETIANGYTHVLPSANVRFQFSSGRMATLSWNATTREPSMTQLQPFTDVSDPLSLYTGNPDLKPEYRQDVSATYRFFDQFSFVNLMAYTRFNWVTDPIVNARTVNQQAVQSRRPINVGTAWSTTGGLDYGRPLRAIGAKISFNYGLGYAESSELVNDVENRNHTLSNSFNGSIENRDKTVFDVRVGGKVTFNNVTYSLNEEFNQSYRNSTLFGNAIWFPVAEWSLNSSINVQTQGQQALGPSPRVTILSASVSRFILNRRAEIQLAGVDLLNQNRGLSVTTGSGFIQEQRVESLGRNVMLGLTYRLGAVPPRPVAR